MSIDATRWAWTQKAIRPSQKLVLLSLADRAGENHVCWPSLKRLVQDTGLDIKTVRLSLNELCDRGLVTRQTVSGRGYTYTLHGVESRERAAAFVPNSRSVRSFSAPVASGDESASPAGSDTPPKNGVTPVPIAGQPRSRNREGGAAENGTQTSHEPFIDRSENPVECPRKRQTSTATTAGTTTTAGAAGAAGAAGKIAKQCFGRFGNVKLTPDEYSKIIGEYGKKGEQAIEKLDVWIGARGDKYKSHYMTMFSWVLRAVDEDEARTPVSFRGAKAHGSSPQGNSVDGQERHYGESYFGALEL